MADEVRNDAVMSMLETPSAHAMDDAKKRVNALIERIRASNLPNKEDLISSLNGALDSGDLKTIDLAFFNTINDVRAVEAEKLQEKAMEIAAELTAEQAFASAGTTRENYLRMVDHWMDTSEYSAPAKEYIHQQSIEALKHSPELQKTVYAIENAPAELREKAEETAQSNYKKQKELVNNPEHAEYKLVLQRMKRMGLLKGEHGQEWLEQVEKHQLTPEEMLAKVNEQVDRQNEGLAPTVNKFFKQMPDGPDKEYIKSHFGKEDGSLNLAQMREQWAQYSTAEIDAAISTQQSGGKLSERQKEIMHLAPLALQTQTVLAATETLRMMTHEVDLSKAITQEPDLAKRQEMIADYLQEKGTNAAVAQKVAHEMVDAIEDNKREGVALDPSNRKAYNKALVSNFTEEMETAVPRSATLAGVEDYNRKMGNNRPGKGTDNDAVPNDILAFYVQAKAEMAETPDYIKNNPERLKAYEDEQKIWKDIAARQIESLADAQKPAEPVKVLSQAELDAVNPYAAMMRDPANMAAFQEANKIAKDNNIVAGDPPAGDPPAQATPNAAAKSTERGLNS